MSLIRDGASILRLFTSVRSNQHESGLKNVHMQNVLLGNKLDPGGRHLKPLWNWKLEGVCLFVCLGAGTLIQFGINVGH